MSPTYSCPTFLVLISVSLRRILDSLHISLILGSVHNTFITHFNDPTIFQHSFPNSSLAFDVAFVMGTMSMALVLVRTHLEPQTLKFPWHAYYLLPFIRPSTATASNSSPLTESCSGCASWSQGPGTCCFCCLLYCLAWQLGRPGSRADQPQQTMKARNFFRAGRARFCSRL